jgi:serine/threonine protein kinase
VLFSDGAQRFKLIDFGFSTLGTRLHYDFCGTPHYIAPEIISKSGYEGPPADIWALGVLMHKLLAGTFPFRGLNDKILYRKICRGEYMKCPEMTDQAADMVAKMLTMDVAERPSAQELLKCEWLQGGKNNTDCKL